MGTFLRARRVRLVAAFSVILVLGSGLAACTEPPPPDAMGLRTVLVDGGFEVHWNSTPQGESNGYLLEYAIGDDEWSLLAEPGTNSYSFTGAVPQTWYRFRVRSGFEPGSEPTHFNGWIQRVYVEPQLPVVRIDTEGHEPVVSKDDYLDATMEIDPNGSSFDAYQGELRIKGRGNSTWKQPKKPYRLKLDDGSKILGMSKDKDWILLANHFDRSQVRTSGAERISKATGLDWTPTYVHVEVLLNGEYLGVYQLTEKVEPEDDRVDIKEMDPEDIAGEKVTGGFLMEIDSRLEENNEPGWRTPRDVPVVVKEPDPMEPEQRSYIRNFVNDFEDLLYSPDYQDPVNGYASVLDVDAFIDHWILQEVTRNGDSFWSSTFFTKDRGEDLLVFGPMWDFDRSMGSPVTPREQPPEGWYARDHGPWVRRLFHDPAFVDRVHQRWDELLPDLQAIPAELEALASALGPSIDNDEARWDYELGPSDTPEFIRTWLETRINWMTQAFDAEAT